MTARAVHLCPVAAGGVANVWTSGLERGAMRRHQRFLGFAACSAFAVLMLGCSGDDPGEQAIEPIPASEGLDDDAAAGTDEGVAAGEDEVEGDVTEADADPSEAEEDADAEVEIDVTVIPDEITPAYVEAVLAELEQLYADALRELILAGEPTIEVTDRLGSAFVEAEYQPRLSQFLELEEDGFSGIASAESLRPRVHSDALIMDLSVDCIYAETTLDLSGVFDEEIPVEVSFVQLGLPDREVVNNLNPTPWMVHAFPVGDDDEMRERRPCDV